MTFNQEKGFSLIQVVIAAGLMGMLSLFMLKMQENQRMSQNKIEMDGEISSFMNKLNGFFQRADYCEKNIVGKYINSTEPFLIEKFLAPNGKPIFEKGEIYGNKSFELDSITKSNFFYDTDDRSSGNLTLMIKLKKHKKSFGSKIIAKKIDLMIYLDDQGKIISCHSNSFGDGGSSINGITTEDIKNVVTTITATPTPTQAATPTPTIVNTVTVTPSTSQQKMLSADEMAQQKAELIKKTIENNPTLQELQKTIKAMEESNKAMQKALDKDGL